MMKRVTAILSIVVLMFTLTINVFANDIDNNNTEEIIRPLTAYDWTQAVWISGYSTAQFKGPAGNNYLFLTTNFPEDNHYTRFVFTWESAPTNANFTIKATHQGDGSSVSSSGSGASGTLTLSGLKKGQYKVEVTNNRGTDMGMRLNLQTSF